MDTGHSADPITDMECYDTNLLLFLKIFEEVGIDIDDENILGSWSCGNFMIDIYYQT